MITIINSNEVEIIPTSNVNISNQTYLNSIKDMITRAIELEPTIILHSDNEILEKYKNSVLAVLDGKIIGSSSLYPTSMKPFDNYKHKGKLQSIGEIGSVIVDPNYKAKGLGGLITKGVVDEYSGNYNAIISATINKAMYLIFQSIGFEDIPFPEEYFNEGKEYLSPKMEGGIEEFEKRARCVMLSNNCDSDFRKVVIDDLCYETIYPYCFCPTHAGQRITESGKLYLNNLA